MRKSLCLMLCLLLLLTAPRAGAVEVTQESCIQKMIAYYFHYRSQAAGEIEHQVAVLNELDPGKAQLWETIMDQWAWANEEMTVTVDLLPEGLPGDDSLCIVVLGYGLEKDGSMKEELVERLKVALRSAETYPEAYVLCTGGETSSVSGITEAGQMGKWLLEQGLEESRLILETKSLSTTENARNSCQLLRRDYPQVKHLAIVSSDYHIRWGTVCFQTEILLQQDKPRLTVAGNAAWDTGDPDRDTVYSQAWGVSILAGVPFDSEWVPELFVTEEEVQPEKEAAPEPVTASVPVPEETEKAEPVLPVLLGLAAVMILIFLPKKKR